MRLYTSNQLNQSKFTTDRTVIGKKKDPTNKKSRKIDDNESE